MQKKKSFFTDMLTVLAREPQATQLPFLFHFVFGCLSSIVKNIVLHDVFVAKHVFSQKFQAAKT